MCNTLLDFFEQFCLEVRIISVVWRQILGFKFFGSRYQFYHSVSICSFLFSQLVKICPADLSRIEIYTLKISKLLMGFHLKKLNANKQNAAEFL
jgi:hypothetical protein